MPSAGSSLTRSSSRGVGVLPRTSIVSPISCKACLLGPVGGMRFTLTSSSIAALFSSVITSSVPPAVLSSKRTMEYRCTCLAVRSYTRYWRLVSVYLTNILAIEVLSSFPRCSLANYAYATHPNILRWLISGFLPVHISSGVATRSPYFRGILLWR
jgi:hypothetical protein